jgi:hypothetical protein
MMVVPVIGFVLQLRQQRLHIASSELSASRGSSSLQTVVLLAICTMTTHRNIFITKKLRLQELQDNVETTIETRVWSVGG